MSQRKAPWLIWSLWLLGLLISAWTLVFLYRNNPSTIAIGVFSVLVELTFLTVGLLIVARRPENLIGWLLLVGSLFEMSGTLALEYAVFALVIAPGTLHWGNWAAWFGDWARSVGFYLEIPFVLLLFPDGRLPSPRWRPVAWVFLGGLVLITVSAIFTPAVNDLRLQSAANPFGIKIGQGLSDFLGLAGFLSDIAGVTMGVAAVLSRFRRAKGDERQQLKWFVYAAVLEIIIIGGIWVATILQKNTNYAVGVFLFSIADVWIPVATGIAILKYRLYDIDILIHRTLVYGVLTAALAVVFFGSVALLQATFSGLSGERSPVAVVISTLAIAGLFSPLRKRIQNGIDRRFYRRKYDAQKTLEAFSMRVREDVQLDQLSQHLLEVVEETMQPEGVGLWLKPTALSRSAVLNSGNQIQRQEIS
jgi:hypothetical protein